MKYLLLLIPLALSAQETRLSVNWVTGIAGNYSQDRLNRPTTESSWRVIPKTNGTDSMVGWDNRTTKGEYSYIRTDYRHTEWGYMVFEFDYYVNNTSGCGYGQAIEQIWLSHDSGKSWERYFINHTPDTMVYYQNKARVFTPCWCGFEMNCWSNDTNWHHFTMVFWAEQYTSIKFAYDYEWYTGRGANYGTPLQGFWLRNFNLHKLDSGIFSDGIVLSLEPKKPRFKQVYIEQEPDYQLYDLIGRKVKFNGAGMYIKMEL